MNLKWLRLNYIVRLSSCNSFTHHQNALYEAFMVFGIVLMACNLQIFPNLVKSGCIEFPPIQHLEMQTSPARRFALCLPFNSYYPFGSALKSITRSSYKLCNGVSWTLSNCLFNPSMNCCKSFLRKLILSSRKTEVVTRF